jgi:hypothetical protein
LLVLVFVFVARQSFPHGKSDQVVLTVAGGIPKYDVITDKDVVKKNAKTIDGSLSDVSKVWGHYAMEPISPGATIRSSQLSSGTVSPAALQGRQVFSLPIKAVMSVNRDQGLDPFPQPSLGLEAGPDLVDPVRDPPTQPKLPALLHFPFSPPPPHSLVRIQAICLPTRLI